MKTALLAVLSLCILSTGTFAQWGGSTTITGITYRNDEVGIGTSAPNAKLSVMSQIPTGAVSSLAILGYGGTTDNRSFSFQQMGNSSTADQYFFLNGGLGSTSVLGTPRLTSAYASSFGLECNDNYLNFIMASPGTNQTAIRALSFFRNGNVGIGTLNTGSYKLLVEGSIAARGIKVTTGPFPDYVFDSSYKRMNLFSLEKFINQHKHLPGIPSAAEVEKEGGIELGEMTRKLLEKVEELTLYTIELKKENEAIKAELAKVKNEETKSGETK